MLNDGDDDDGLSLLYNVPESSSAYLDSLLVQADYYQTNGLIETAKDKLIRALQLAPEEDAIKFGLAEIEYLSGNYEQALELYQDLIKRQSTFSEVNLYQRLFATFAKLGNYEEAAKVIREHANSILDIDSKYEAGLVLLSVGDDKQAIKFLDEVIEQSPDYVNAYPLLAQANAISSNAWFMFKTMLAYKCNWYGKQLIMVDPKNTSRICSNCGNKNHDFDNLTQSQWLNIRNWTCPYCHKNHDRDINAAKNILNRGLNQTNIQLVRD